MREWMVVLHEEKFLIKEFKSSFGYSICSGHYRENILHPEDFYIPSGSLCRFAIISNLSNGVLISFQQFHGNSIKSYDSWAFEGIRLEEELDVRKLIDLAMERGVVFEDNSKFRDGYVGYRFSGSSG